MNVSALALAMCLGSADIPDLAEASRFPDSTHAQTQWEIAYVHEAYVEQLSEFYSGGYLGPWYAEWAREARRRKLIWYAVGDVNNPAFSDEYRQVRLMDLRDMIGREDYAAGYVPPCVPLEYFQRIR
jgi:hypothetical protein